MSKIACFGGSFNPPHLGHLKIALSVLRQEKFDEIWFLPTCETPLKNHPMASFEDRVQCLEVLSAGLENIDELKARIQKIFADEKEGIMFSTVHRSKGLENEKVFIVCPERLPLKRKGMKPWQHEQEKNLEYVAYTRAKSYLGIVTDYSYRNK